VDWKDAQPDADSCRLDLRFSLTSTNGFLFGAEPAFPFALVDLGLVVVALSRHVVDALAAGIDVTLGRGRIVVRHQATRAECR
jgi:hypothetical protein